MSSVADWTRHHRLAAFWGLAFAVAWAPWPLAALGLFPFPFLPAGPLVAALVVIGIADGRDGFRDLGARMTRWRVGWVWWMVALGTPLAVLAVGAAANVAVWGAPAPVIADMAWGAIALNFAVRFVDPTDGPMGEEPGWRGFALPWLQTERSPLASGMLLGAVVAVWHLPLIVVGQLGATGIPVTFAITLVYVWLFNRTGGSALMTLVFHVVQGTVSYAALGLTGADAVRMDWLTGGLWMAITVGVVVLDRDAWRVAPEQATARRVGMPVR